MQTARPEVRTAHTAAMEQNRCRAADRGRQRSHEARAASLRRPRSDGRNPPAGRRPAPRQDIKKGCRYRHPFVPAAGHGPYCTLFRRRIARRPVGRRHPAPRTDRNAPPGIRHARTRRPQAPAPQQTRDAPALPGTRPQPRDRTTTPGRSWAPCSRAAAASESRSCPWRSRSA